MPLGVVAELAALAGVCWLLGEYLAGERLLTALVLGGVQLLVHVTLDSATMHDGMAMSGGIASSLMMTAAHLTALLAGVLAVSQARRWVCRVLRTFARLLPQLPELHPVRTPGRVFAVVLSPRRLVGSWLDTNVSRRGPPGVRVIPVV